MEKYSISSSLLISKKTLRNFIPIRIITLITLQTLLTLQTVFSQPVTQEWVRRWPEPSLISSSGREIKQDGLGNIYVLADTGLGFGFLKYDPNGNLLFHTTYWPGGSYTSGGGRYFDITSDGNVYITGSVDINFDYWIYTVKFNSSGAFQWGRLYNLDNLDGAEDIKVDVSGNIIVIGGSLVGSINYALVIKYNNSGDTLWTRHFNGGQNYAIANKIVFDSTDNIYLACDLGVPGESLVMKYNSNGNLIWFTSVTFYQGLTTLGLGISLDVNRNVYVIGTQVLPQSQYGTYLLKLNNSGDTLWSRSYPNYGTGNNSLWGPVVSSNGNSIYYTGSFRDTVGSGYNIVTLKYNSSGNLQWAKIYNGGILNHLNLPSGIKMDRYNNIYICGTGYYQTTGSDFLTIKYSAGGDLQWVMTYTGLFSNSGDYANDIFVDPNLCVYVTGKSRKISNNGIDAVTIKYNQPSGIISSSNEIPNQYSLSQNYPNPFNPKTHIEFAIPPSKGVRGMSARLNIYDVLGREIAVLVNQQLTPGTYEVNFDASNYPSGVYFYRLTAVDYTETKKMVLIK